MSKMLSIAKYEYKMQIKRIAGWIVLLFGVVSSMMDCLPIASNLARIEFLGDIHYYVRRVFSFDGLILLFGILYGIDNPVYGQNRTIRGHSRRRHDFRVCFHCKKKPALYS